MEGAADLAFTVVFIIFIKRTFVGGSCEKLRIQVAIFVEEGFWLFALGQLGAHLEIVEREAEGSHLAQASVGTTEQQLMLQSVVALPARVLVLPDVAQRYHREIILKFDRLGLLVV